MQYLDTSLLVPLFTREPMTEAVYSWIDTQESGVFAVSEWVETEFASALATKIRTEQILESDADAAIENFDSWRENFLWLTFDPWFFRDAKRFLLRFEGSLRASDALHLAILTAHDAQLCTRDRRFHETAVGLGVPSMLF